MFTINDLSEHIDMNDFDVLERDANSITLQSKNTSVLLLIIHPFTLRTVIIMDQTMCYNSIMRYN